MSQDQSSREGTPLSEPLEAKPSPQRGASRREREFRRYAEAVVGLRDSAEGHAVSSRDLSLTAFAQLVALRLGAKRAIISLFDKERQYIIAEATGTLSLQHDEVHELGDGICYGASVLERTEGDMYRQVLKRRYFEVTDLLNDERFASHPAVVNEPHGRAFAGVPILAPSKYAIGVLSFLDDRKREMALKDEEIVFMQDVAKTIIAHLEMCRTTVRHARGLKMVQGISRFVEGKSGIEEDDETAFKDAAGMRDHQAAQTSNLRASGRTNAMNAASNAERIHEYQHSQTISYEQSVPDQGQQQSPLATTVSVAAGVSANSVHGSAANGTPKTLSTKSSFDAQDGISKDMRNCFERAATIINSSMSLAGTLFLDASVTEYNRLRSSTEGTTSPESEGSNSKSDSAKSVAVAAVEKQEDADMLKLKPCRHLASAYNITSAEGDQVVHRPIPERFLKSLMRRFPYGKIWNLDVNGSTSSDEFSESSAVTDQAAVESDQAVVLEVPPKPKRKRTKPDGAILAQLFPGVRSLALMPMYDAARERFFAGAIVWTYDPIRILTMQDDANYLAAFCDVVMSEVNRLDAQAEAKTKTSFISSISHELRSPLHGILGGIECLQDKDNAVVQEDMLQMIESSGKSLLDIINHLLEHAHASSSEHRSQKLSKTFRSREASTLRHSTTRYNTGSLHQPPHDIALLTEEVLDTALWSTPKPTPLPDRELRRGSVHVGSSTSPIKVILEVDRSEDFIFKVNSGAWRRIVQNLVTNSLKYTDTGGYLKLSLNINSNDEETTEKGKTVVELTCMDSGRGMSQQFLKYGLWRSFSQEDSQSQGTGLGLSLVHGIVKEMNGKIDVQSSKGVGTAIRVTVPLLRASPSRRMSSDHEPEESDEATTKARLRHCTYATLGFGEDDGSGKRASQASDVLKESIAKACNSYGMTPTAPGQTAHIYILPEHKATQLAQTGPQNDTEKAACVKPTIVLCHSVASSRAFALSDSNMTNLVPVPQPLGPKKLFKALAACLGKLPSDASPTSRLKNDNVQATNISAMPSRPLVPAKRKGSDSTIQTPNRHVRHPSSPTSPISPTPQSVVPASGLRTLLVDDNSLNLTLLCTYMRRNGHSYICAGNGLEAVNAYKEAYLAVPEATTPLLVLMDLTMPVMGGLEATRHIRAFEREQSHTAERHARSNSSSSRSDDGSDSRRGSSKGSVPPPAMIVALTAVSDPETKMNAFGSGVDLYLTKPVGFKNLAEILKGVLEESRQ